VALLNIAKALDKVDVDDADEKSGVSIVRKAIEEPAKWLAANAGMEGAVVVERVKSEKAGVGYNVATGKFEDLLKAGIIDATKVTRLALQNAASVASLLLTTEALVVEKGKKKAAGAPGGYNPEDMDM
jgi:chaperonin GroEL